MASISDYFFLTSPLFVTSQDLLIYSCVFLQYSREETEKQEVVYNIICHSDDVGAGRFLLLESFQRMILSRLQFLLCYRCEICPLQPEILSLGKALSGTKIMGGCVLNLTQDHIKWPSV